MATEVELGTEITITVTFRDYTNSPNGDAADPLFDAIVEIYQGVSLVLSDTSTRVSKGTYSYTYEPTSLGDYEFRFTGDFETDDATPQPYQIVVSEEVSVAEIAQNITLGRNQEIVFATEVTPLLMDPEDFAHVYPEASLVEIMEIVHKHTLEVNRIFSSYEEIPQIAYEYLENAVLCSLGQIYSDSIVGDGSSITLGDLQVSGGTRFNGNLNRGNATNACERAFVLRQEMLRWARASKVVVKGERVTAKLPDRDLRYMHNFPKKGRGGKTF